MNIAIMENECIKITESFYWPSTTDVAVEFLDQLDTVERLRFVKFREFIDIFYEDVMRGEFVLIWYEPNDYL